MEAMTRPPLRRAGGGACGVLRPGVTTNMLAVAVEPGYCRPILPSFHGGWTVGGILASALILAPASLPWSSTAVATLPYLLASGVQRLAGEIGRASGREVGRRMGDAGDEGSSRDHV